jgi:signal transduction histidine kinase
MASQPLPPPTHSGMDCPHCEAPLPPEVRSCPNCGVDLVLVALLAERALLEGAPPERTYVAPQADIPRLGQYLVQHGLVSPDQLASAVRRQARLAAQGDSRLLGQVLLDQQVVNREELDRAITHQILELHVSLQEANRTLEARVAERTAELRRALERLSELSQVKANLISNVSHELRTPLGHVKGYVELLAANQLGSLTPEQAQAVGVMQRAVERLERRVKDLVEYSDASRQGLALNLQPVDLSALAAQVVERSRTKAENAGVELGSALARSLRPVQGDHEKLGWVLHQLVDNAIKFTPAGGRAWLETAEAETRAQVCVRDTGIGIPAERMDEVFEPFHQLDASPTRRFGGTGLGLSLVRLILDAHGAPVRIESQEGAGTCVCFRLSFVPEAP